MDYRERRSHARDVYHTQDTSRMGIVRVRQKEGADNSNRKKVVKRIERKERGHEGEKVSSMCKLTLRT